MKPLNRPMFRYGGPIKEGVMSGIREPKKDGGMLLVGEHPKEFKDAGGREKHVAPLVVGAGMGLARLAPLAMRAARPVANFFKGTAPATVRTGLGRTRVPTTMERMSSLFKTSPAGKYLIGSPEGRLIAGGSGVAGKVGRGALKGGKYLASSPLTLATAGYYGGKALLPDGTPDPNAPGGPDGPPSVLNPRKEKTTGTGTSTGGGVEMSPEQLRKKNVERYRDIMDIKGMNKDAAYNSLIAASQAINQSGDFKGDIKSGRLINEIIQATSKQFDKPKATKDAIDTLILKGEIDKDIKASDPTIQQRARLTEKQIALADKQLAGDSLQDTVNAIYAKTGAFPSGSGLAGVARTKGIDVKMVIKSEDINNFIEQNPGKDAVDFMESQVLEATKAGTPVQPGAYVVKDRIIVIDSEGNVSPYL
jgi:hypothetical protein